MCSANGGVLIGTLLVVGVCWFRSGDGKEIGGRVLFVISIGGVLVVTDVGGVGGVVRFVVGVSCFEG